MYNKDLYNTNLKSHNIYEGQMREWTHLGQIHESDDFFVIEKIVMTNVVFKYAHVHVIKADGEHDWWYMSTILSLTRPVDE